MDEFNAYKINIAKPNSHPFNAYLVKDEVEIERLVPKNAVIIQTKGNRDESKRQTKERWREMKQQE